MNKKTVTQLCGIVFLALFAYAVYGCIHFFLNMFSYPITTMMLSLVRNIYHLFVLLLLGITALAGRKERGKVLNILALVDIGLNLIGLLRGAVYSFSVPTFLTLAVYAAAVFFSGGKEFFNPKDNDSNAAKREAQTKSQNTLYDDQLRDGLITQEEYDQIMSDKSN